MRQWKPQAPHESCDWALGDVASIREPAVQLGHREHGGMNLFVAGYPDERVVDKSEASRALGQAFMYQETYPCDNGEDTPASRLG